MNYHTDDERPMPLYFSRVQYPKGYPAANTSDERVLNIGLMKNRVRIFDGINKGMVPDTPTIALYRRIVSSCEADFITETSKRI